MEIKQAYDGTAPAAPAWPTCGKCGGRWGSLTSERLDAWCITCSREHAEEYKPVFRAHVLKHRGIFLEMAGVPAAFRGCGLDNFADQTRDQQRARDAVRTWAEAGCSAGLYLHGPVGTGKSHLAIAAMLEATARRRLTARYIAVHQFLLEARESFRERNTQPLSALLDRCTETGVLLLDDLCAEKSTEFARETFLTMVDRAYGRRRPLLLATSNLDLSDLGCRLDGRIADRLREMCLIVNVGGSSYRRRIAVRRDLHTSAKKTFGRGRGRGWANLYRPAFLDRLKAARV